MRKEVTPHYSLKESRIEFEQKQSLMYNKQLKTHLQTYIKFTFFLGGGGGSV